jgi:hypothetical protein
MGKQSKALLVQLCGEIFIVGGTLSATIASLAIINPAIFGPSEVWVEPLSPLLALPFLLLTICAGFIAGIALWIRTMRRFCSRAQLQQYLTRPYIPIASDLMEKLFDLVYDAVRKPYQLKD